MDKKILPILKKIYHYENGFCDELDRHAHTIPATVSADDLKLLEENGLQPNHFETFTHDGAIERFLKLKANPKLMQDFVIALFYKGITGENPRFRQPLMSFVYLKHLEKHAFTSKGDYCEICGLKNKIIEDKTHNLYTYYLGHSWNEFPLHFLVELEEILKYEQPKITQQDRQFLIDLLKFIEKAEPNETAGQLEKRLAAAKILPNTDKYKRYGILETLSELGVLPNDLIKPQYDGFATFEECQEAYKKLKGSPRSDIVLPFGAWRGRNGVDWQRYKEIFE